jgi:heme/copper-type cytochrome/quinol oxidase subunit 2
MRRALVIALIALAAVAATVIPTYAYFNSFRGYAQAQNGYQIKTPGEIMFKCRPRGYPPRLEVSEDFKQRVLGIAESDSDVKNLLSEGYNITAIRPIVKAFVQGDGTVTVKATGAVLLLSKDKTGWANVEVDVEAGKVIKIIIHSRTVIQKGS